MIAASAAPLYLPSACFPDADSTLMRRRSAPASQGAECCSPLSAWIGKWARLRWWRPKKPSPNWELESPLSMYSDWTIPWLSFPSLSTGWP